MLAQIHETDPWANKYAYECIDLLDLYRQVYRGEYTKDDEALFRRMEEDAKDVIDDVARPFTNPGQLFSQHRQTPHSPSFL